MGKGAKSSHALNTGHITISVTTVRRSVEMERKQIATVQTKLTKKHVKMHRINKMLMQKPILSAYNLVFRINHIIYPYTISFHVRHLHVIYIHPSSILQLIWIETVKGSNHPVFLLKLKRRNSKRPSSTSIHRRG